MLSSCSSNAILAKVRAIFGKRLTAAEYAQMARKRDVGEVAAILKENPSYTAALRHVGETTVHRGQLEALLKKDLFYKYSALRRYDFSDTRFYDFVLVRMEIDEILRCIMLMQSRESTDFIVDMPSYLLNHTSFNLMELAKVTDFESLLRALAHTAYEEPLRRYAASGGEISLLNCEHALYSAYYTHLLHVIDQSFRGKTREQLRQEVLAEIDAKNLQRIFRLKLYFGQDPAQITALLYPYSEHLRPALLEELLAAPDFAEMLKLLPKLAGEGKTYAAEDGIEPFARQFTYNLERKLLRFTTKAPVAMYAFLSLREMEVGNIVTIIEGVRYQMPQEEIMRMLIL